MAFTLEGCQHDLEQAEISLDDSRTKVALVRDSLSRMKGSVSCFNAAGPWQTGEPPKDSAWMLVTIGEGVLSEVFLTRWSAGYWANLGHIKDPVFVKWARVNFQEAKDESS